MKKQSLLSLIAASALCGAASAQTLSVADVEALPGETVSYTLTIDVKGGDYKGFQYQMNFPEEGFFTEGTTVASTDWDGASFSVGDLDDAGQANASAYSSSDVSIPDGERAIGTVKFKVGDDVAIGDYDVTISDFNFLDGTNYVSVANVTFKVNVVAVHTIVLDENSTTVPADAEGVNVRVRRTIKAGDWSSICLPFAMTAEQVTTAFGTDVKIGDFQGCDVDDETGDVKVKFSEVTAMETNHPYIIKVGTDVSEFTANGVDIAPEESPAVDKDAKKLSRTVTVYNSFVGNYVSGTVLDDGLMFLADNNFNFSAGSTKIKAFRGYFDFTAADVFYESRRFILSFEDAATGIVESMRGVNEAEDRCYSLGGQCVSKPSKGVYVKDGKKVIIK